MHAMQYDYVLVRLLFLLHVSCYTLVCSMRLHITVFALPLLTRCWSAHTPNVPRVMGTQMVRIRHGCAHHSGPHASFAIARGQPLLPYAYTALASVQACMMYISTQCWAPCACLSLAQH